MRPPMVRNGFTAFPMFKYCKSGTKLINRYDKVFIIPGIESWRILVCQDPEF